MKTLHPLFQIVAATALALALTACGNGGPSKTERMAAFKAHALASGFHPSEAEVDKALNEELAFPSCTPAKTGTAFVCLVTDKTGKNDDHFDIVLDKVGGKWTVTGAQL